MKKDVVKILLAVAALISFGVFCNAQSLGGDFSIDLIPSDPLPNTEARARISSFHFDANRAKITWELDGKALLSGMGERDFTFTSPDLGKERHLTVYVITADGAQSKKTINLIGQDIDLLWEALTYTPPWYKGMAVPVIESLIKVTAVSHLFSGGKELLSSDLVYEWSLNFKKDIRASGAGKNSFNFQLKDFDDYSVVLKVSNRDSSAVFEKGFTISADNISTSPKIIFYENKPMEGVLYSNALNGEIQLNDSEISVKAEPFFFSKRNMGSLNYEWTMNGEKISSDEVPNIVTLRAEGGTGSANIGLRINNPINILQFAEKAFLVNYGQ